MNRSRSPLIVAIQLLLLSLPAFQAQASAQGLGGPGGLRGGDHGAVSRLGPYTPPADAAALRAASEAAAAAAAAAPRIAERYGLAALAELDDSAVAAPDRLAALRAWNEAHRLPVHNGFERALPAPRQVTLSASLVAANPLAEQGGGLAVQTAFDKLAWGGLVRVTHAYRLRLHLAQVSLPAGARLWVTGGGHTAGPFGRELIGADGGLWTPSVPGEEAALDVELPAAALAGGARFGFTLDKTLEMVDLGTAERAPTPKESMACNLDASCFSTSDFPAIDAVRHAVAMIFFVDQGEGGQCTGELLNSSVPGAPLMLTANHCISTAGGANSLEAFWDFYTPSCNGPMPDMDSVPSSFGATLLSTGAAGGGQAASDFTLMRLDNIPAGRTFLGWNPSPAAAPGGTLLYGISHPDGLTQDFVVTSSDPNVVACDGVPRPNFLYSDQVKGGTFGGSSGSAVMLANGDVVGQLYGGCGSDDDCSPQQFRVDGAFAQSYLTLQQFLQGSTGPGGVCKPDKLTLCLLDKRFRVQVSWTNQFNGAAGSGLAIPSTDSTGFFYFTDPTNYELIVKILPLNAGITVFYGELTDLQFVITVTDTASGTVKTFTNTPGDCGGFDNDAFPATAAAPVAAGDQRLAIGKKAGTCAPSSNTLCLLDRRFAIKVNWMNQFDGSSGVGSGRSLSDESGFFTFTDPTVLELVMKVVDFGNRTAFFWGALSNLEYDISVTDTVGGTTKSYHNPAGTFCGGLDNSAFPP